MRPFQNEQSRLADNTEASRNPSPSVERGGRTIFIHMRMNDNGDLTETGNTVDPVTLPSAIHGPLGSDRIDGHDAVFVIGQRPRPEAMAVSVSGNGSQAEGLDVGTTLTRLNQELGFCGTSVYASLHNPE